MWPIFKRELRAYFLSPIGYVFIGLFLLVGSQFFASEILAQYMTDIGRFLYPMTLVLSFIIPILTMRLLAEERKSGTEQLLFTSPKSITEIVLGKYFAALVVFLVAVLFILAYGFIVVKFGKPHMPQFWVDYLGFVLLGSVYIAIGLFASSLTENQVVSAVLSFTFLLIMWLIDFMQSLNLPSFIIKSLQWTSLMSRYRDFLIGSLKLEHVVYFVSFAALFIFFTVQVIEKRRLSKG